MSVLQKADLLRLAGVNLVVGVDVREQRARIVALKRVSYSLGKRKPLFRAVHYCMLEFPPDSSCAEQGQRIRKALSASGVQPRFAVGTVRSLGVKHVTTCVPDDVEDIEEWISDHSDKLLRISLPQESVMFQYEYLDPVRRQIEVAFVRKEDIGACRRLFEESGLDLIALGAGVRDAVNPMVVEEVEAGTTFLYHEDHSITQIELEKERRGHMKERTAEDKLAPGETSRNLVCAGPGVGAGGIRPLGLPSEYTLAVGLALKGFLPWLSPMNFVGEAQTASFALTVHRLLAKRLALVCGTVLAFLLAIPLAGGMLLQSELERLEVQGREAGPLYREAGDLERQIRSLEAGMTGRMNRSIVGHILYEIASSAPDSLWFARLAWNAEPEGTLAVSVSGYTLSHARVAQFLRRLQTETSSRQVVLIRSSMNGQEETVLPVTDRRGLLFFEIRSSFPDRYP